MWTTSKAIDFCAGHRLMQYEGGCANPHGHNFRAIIQVNSELINDSGMVIDFKEIKELVKAWIDQNWDHGFICNQYDTRMIDFLAKNDFKYYVITDEVVQNAYEDAQYDLNRFIRGAKIPVHYSNPTMENLALILQYQVNRLFKLAEYTEYDFIQVRLYESPDGWVDV